MLGPMVANGIKSYKRKGGILDMDGSVKITTQITPFGGDAIYLYKYRSDSRKTRGSSDI